MTTLEIIWTGAQVFALATLGISAAVYHATRSSLISSNSELRVRAEMAEAEVTRLTPPAGEFKFCYLSDDLPRAQFFEIVKWLAEQHPSRVSWDASERDGSGQWSPRYENKLHISTLDKSTAIMFKLRFGGAL